MRNLQQCRKTRQPPLYSVPFRHVPQVQPTRRDTAVSIDTPTQYSSWGGGENRGDSVLTLRWNQGYGRKRYDTRHIAPVTCGTHRYAPDDANAPATSYTGATATVTIHRGRLP